ncbi:unnamed protein product [Paramecium primaurelia]|uniref:Uncharacterized protein n=2 Tax=Paramecium TaxID=5884 RepID=A0A8S1VIT4_9CILI|nr:unnamed protein product [Paramecium primaurelia]CAD8176215.1 unnamed protein product [Paramecium pentaurelia]
MIALEHCQQLLELYILEFSDPDQIQVHDDEPQTPVFDRHTTQHVQSVLWKRQSIRLLDNSSQKEFEIKKDYGLFETYEPKPQLIVVDRDKSDDKYRLEAMKKKKDKRNAKLRDQNLPYNEYIHPAKQIQVKLLLSKKPLKDYQTYDSDGSIMRRREQVKQLSPIVNTVKSKLQGRVDQKQSEPIAEENIINQQALFKLKVATKVKTQYDEPYNFEAFPLKTGVKLTFTQEKKKKEEEKLNNEEEDLTDADTYQLQKFIKKPSYTTLPLFKLPKKKQNITHERSFRTLRLNKGFEY